MSNDEIIWTYLRNEGLTEYAVAGIMGNLYAESGLQSNILQITYQSSLGMSSDEYTVAVDNGSYSNFVNDAAGYGLAQWTFWSRKQDLLNMAKGKHVSIGNLTMQLDFLCSELQEFGLWSKLNNCKSVRDASNIILFEYEKPQDMSTSVQNARTNWSMEYFDKFAGKPITQTFSEPVSSPSASEYCVIVYQKFNTLADAQLSLAAAQGYGFSGMIMPVLSGFIPKLRPFMR